MHQPRNRKSSLKATMQFLLAYLLPVCSFAQPAASTSADTTLDSNRVYHLNASTCVFNQSIEEFNESREILFRGGEGSFLHSTFRVNCSWIVRCSQSGGPATFQLDVDNPVQYSLPGRWTLRATVQDGCTGENKTMTSEKLWSEVPTGRSVTVFSGVALLLELNGIVPKELNFRLKNTNAACGGCFPLSLFKHTRISLGSAANHHASAASSNVTRLQRCRWHFLNSWPMHKCMLFELSPKPHPSNKLRLIGYKVRRGRVSSTDPAPEKSLGPGIRIRSFYQWACRSSAFIINAKGRLKPKDTAENTDINVGLVSTNWAISTAHPKPHLVYILQKGERVRIESPGHPEHLAANTEQFWNIGASDGRSKIRLVLTDLAVRNVTHEYLKGYEAYTSASGGTCKYATFRSSELASQDPVTATAQLTLHLYTGPYSWGPGFQGFAELVQENATRLLQENVNTVGAVKKWRPGTNASWLFAADVPGHKAALKIEFPFIPGGTRVTVSPCGDVGDQETTVATQLWVSSPVYAPSGVAFLSVKHLGPSLSPKSGKIIVTAVEAERKGQKGLDDFDCSFAHGFCKWINVVGRWKQAIYPEEGYVYTDDFGRLQSPHIKSEFPGSDRKCSRTISFWYMAERGVFEVVWMPIGHLGGGEKQLWNNSDTRIEFGAWQKAVIRLPEHMPDYQLLVRLYSFTSRGVRLKHMLVSECDGWGVRSSSWRCARMGPVNLAGHKYVPNSFHCDGYRDCKNDEAIGLNGCRGQEGGVRWSKWSAWRQCHQFFGQQRRTRLCFNQNGMRLPMGVEREWLSYVQCGNKSHEDRKCTPAKTTTTTLTTLWHPWGEWSPWSSWQSCPRTCDTCSPAGYKIRRRMCYRGLCHGSAEQYIGCCGSLNCYAARARARGYLHAAIWVPILVILVMLLFCFCMAIKCSRRLAKNRDRQARHAAANRELDREDAVARAWSRSGRQGATVGIIGTGTGELQISSYANPTFSLPTYDEAMADSATAAHVTSTSTSNTETLANQTNNESTVTASETSNHQPQEAAASTSYLCMSADAAVPVASGSARPQKPEDQPPSYEEVTRNS